MIKVAHSFLASHPVDVMKWWLFRLGHLGKNPFLMSRFIAGVGLKSFSKRVASPHPRNIIKNQFQTLQTLLA
jgi:hypothetical protein